MSSPYRVVDDGTSLTVGKVIYDLNGDPVTVEFDILHSSHLSGLVAIVQQIQIAFREPVLSLEESGCEVI
jgi:hypothetical protein